MTTALHAERLAAVLEAVRETGARSVADLGCGAGDLLIPLAGESQLERVLGLEISETSLARARERVAALGAEQRGRIALRRGSMTEARDLPRDVEAALLVETIEHIAPGRLSALEQAVFRAMGPPWVIVSTPNAEFNPLLGVPPHRYRHADHRFEWSRAEFRRWCRRVSGEHGYDATIRDVGGAHPNLGGASQMAIFHYRRG